MGRLHDSRQKAAGWRSGGTEVCCSGCVVRGGGGFFRLCVGGEVGCVRVRVIWCVWGEGMGGNDNGKLGVLLSMGCSRLEYV